jgi:cholesterol transport system auxiliary component
MIPIRQWTRVAGLVLAAAALSGCITLLPKSKPAQLYRFDGRAALAALKPTEDQPAARRVGLSRTAGSFAFAAAGDRILTVTGSQVAYVAGSRWSGPASLLLDEAIINAFSVNGGPAKLVSRGEPARAAYTLRLDVGRFEANYDQGANAPPRVTIETHAELVRSSDRAVVGDKIFRAEVRASDNRVSAIVSAFDKAVGVVLVDLVAWTNQTAAPI